MKPFTNSLERTYDESALYGIHRLKSQIVKQISHEFRTPLTSIIGFAEILEDDSHIAEDQRIEFASYIRNEGLRLTKLIDDLVGLDCLEHGQADIELKDQEIQGTVRQAVTRIAEFAYSKFIRVSLHVPNEPVIIKFDREKIVEVLYQLLHNSVRFTKPGGLVNLKVEETDKHVLISLHDGGPGIPSEDIPFLFKRFGKHYRHGREAHCTGVGLAIVKQIVDQHNGDIAVQSQIGEGSTFIVRLPIFR
jgi:two-component system, OmpR family, phosphate regulon sensor histidine kinase PhoR